MVKGLLDERDTRMKKCTCFFGPIPQKTINKKYFQYTLSQNYLGKKSYFNE